MMEAADWTYWGENGPDSWPGICATGEKQSPINIVTDKAIKTDIKPFKFIRYDFAFSGFVTNTGHTIQISLNGIPIHLQGGGLPSTYVLEQMHFHWSAEHTIDGVRAPLELHYVHYDKKYENIITASKYKDGIAVVAVLFELDYENNEDLTKILNSVTSVLAWIGRSTARLQTKIVPLLLLPKDRHSFFRYQGSLTTPGCQESVIWSVFTEKLPISNSQIDQANGRKVLDGYCTCKASMLLCKHAAAICIYVNEENTLSRKLMYPMIWNRPPEQQLEKYRKGSRMESMFPSEQGNIIGDTVYTFQQLENISEAHRAENCAFIHLLHAEEKCSKEREARETLKGEEELRYRQLFSQLFKVQEQDYFNRYHAQQYVIDENGYRVLSRINCPEEYATFYSNRVQVSEGKLVDICFMSLHQSTTAAWFDERAIRITCSEKAHQIKTRRKDFEKLAKRFRKNSKGNIRTKAMNYGLEMEPVSRRVFEAVIKQELYATGLVIKFAQPFLACSPDGVIFNGETFVLLEIKCPFSCAESTIVDFQDQKSSVDYLKVNENGICELVKSHKYYTQIQLSMYVLGVKLCHFFVYSKIQCVHLKINRDEELLSNLVPKIEKFYFDYYIGLCEESATA